MKILDGLLADRSDRACRRYVGSYTFGEGSGCIHLCLMAPCETKECGTNRGGPFGLAVSKTTL